MGKLANVALCGKSQRGGHIGGSRSGLKLRAGKEKDGLLWDSYDVVIRQRERFSYAAGSEIGAMQAE